MAWDDRFQEAQEYRGGRCSNCDAPITDENETADIVTFTRVERGANGYAWEKSVTPGCQHEARLQAMKNAVAFLQDDIRRQDGDYDNVVVPEDAIAELCEAFRFEYRLPANV